MMSVLIISSNGKLNVYYSIQDKTCLVKPFQLLLIVYSHVDCDTTDPGYHGYGNGYEPAN